MTLFKENEYIVDYDKSGLIRARFVIASGKKPWKIIEILDEKVKAKFPTTYLRKIRTGPYELDVTKDIWSIRWGYKGWKDRNKITL